jgi:RHS repeat-associated protein
LQGAGGVGGLLAQITDNGSTVNCYYPLYDHNGNVEKYITGNGTVVAEFQYDGFGNTISESYSTQLETGNSQPETLFPFRFSAKYWDEETGLYYYGYRYYSPEKGRWIKLDPLGENGGLNLYAAMRNQPVGLIDILGGNVGPAKCNQTYKMIYAYADILKNYRYQLAYLISLYDYYSSGGDPKMSTSASALGGAWDRYRGPAALTLGGSLHTAAASSRIANTTDFVENGAEIIINMGVTGGSEAIDLLDKTVSPSSVYSNIGYGLTGLGILSGLDQAVGGLQDGNVYAYAEGTANMGLGAATLINSNLAPQVAVISAGWTIGQAIGAPIGNGLVDLQNKSIVGKQMDKTESAIEQYSGKLNAEADVYIKCCR